MTTNTNHLNADNPFPNGPPDMAAVQDLYTRYIENTEKLRQAFERLEQRFREIDPYNIYNSIAEGLVTLDAAENILTFNLAAQKIFALKEDDVVGKSFRSILPACVSAFEEFLATESAEKHYEISFKNENGDPVFLRGRFSPLLDRNGEDIGTTCLFTDLSVERLLEEKARRSDRLTALGELAAGVAHEMRNPLTTIRGYLQILPDNKHDEEFIQEFSENLIREIDRLTRLTDDLLNMAKPISPELEVVDLADLVTAVALFLSDKLSNARVELFLDEKDELTTPVLVDGDRIKQVFINLIVNAIEAMEEGGKLSIRFSRRDERFTETEDSRTYAVAEIIDTGPGISKQVMDRLFDPFFTTKDTGTGLGLSLSNRIVDEHNGFLRVDSTSGEGTRFWVFLPLVEQTDM
ncbi:PAS domain-containing protein [bacterium]|nr:PAS domain-containing protein [bacterium]